MTERIPSIYEEVTCFTGQEAERAPTPNLNLHLAQRATDAAALEGGELTPDEMQRILNRLNADYVHGC